MSENKRLCCCIPNQENLSVRCQNKAEYEIWFGFNPSPDDFTDSCSEHLSQMIDECFTRFEVFRVKNEDIDCADVVFHVPTQEEWTVAAVENSRVYWCGYPFGGAGNLPDCILRKKATDDERINLLRSLSQNSGSERPIILAKERVSRIDKPAADAAAEETK